jgi:ATP/maltotriose-dependent transcriptional regulator MalT/DNA-binding SARP family transcriptional activator
VPRPRLEEEVQRLVEHYRTVVVTASAGAGKTTAVLKGAMRTGRPLAWLSAATTDADTGHLLVYLEAALAAAVPRLDGVASAAMAAGVAHVEVAALLAEEVGDVPLLLVIDDLEVLADADSAIAVLSSFARFLPEDARVVLIGRRDVAFDLGSDAIGAVAGVGEGELAFTQSEVVDALALAGSPAVDAVDALKATGGWVAGVLFEAWRSAEHVPGMGGEADPLHGYLASQILGDLPPDEVDLLVLTSVLDEVDAAGAAALGMEDPGPVLRRLHRRHLPVGWDAAGTTLRCHPRFREYLLELLGRRPSAEVREVRRRQGQMLVSSGHDEEAVRAFMQADALDDALDAARRCLDAVVERADLRLASEWLAALAPVNRDRCALASAELMLAVAAENYRSAVKLADELREAGKLDDFVSSSARAGALMSWCHMHVGEVRTARSILAMTPPGSPKHAMQYCLSMLESDSPSEPPPHLTGESFDALIMRCHYYRGDFELAHEHALSGWAERVSESWRIGALLDTGRIDDAVRLLRAAEAAGETGAWFLGVLKVRVMSRLGDVEGAHSALHSGRARILATGSKMLELFSFVEEAELELRLTGDRRRGESALAQVLNSPLIEDYPFVREHALMLSGLARLRAGDDADAAAHLCAAVEDYLRSDRLLGLPQAGVYLAEAQWRLGDADDADHAADVALEAARRQGSNFLLLEAIKDFPAVLSRRLDSESSLDSAWHEVGRARLALGLYGERSDVDAEVLLTDFGEIALSVGGARVKPRIRKSYELLAYILTRNAGSLATRSELLEALFDGRDDNSALSYLRQALHQLRQTLPPDTLLTRDGGGVGITPEASVTTDSARFLNALAQAQALRGQERYEALLRAIGLASAGEYLPAVDTAWAEHRRAELKQKLMMAHFEAAQAAYELDRVQDAQQLLAHVLSGDPYLEPAWRLAMRLADANGDERGVVEAYRGCERALHQLGAEPALTTRKLFHNLRR